MNPEDRHGSTAVADEADADFIVPMSLAQERLWFIERLSTAGALFHLHTVTRLPPGADPNALEAALNEIVRRHESLRTTFDVIDEVPSQIVHARMRVRLPIVDLTELPSSWREPTALEQAQGESERPFDLRTGPLLRATLFVLGPGDWLLAVTIHHLVSDGWSMGLFWRELSLLSRAFAHGDASPLPELETQYADYAVWQRDLFSGPTLDRELAFWRRTLADLPPTLELPTDRPRPAVQSFRGALYKTKITASAVERAARLGHEEGGTLFMVLLAGLQSLLHRYTGAEDVVIGTYTAGRERPETEAIIGFFLNTLVLRTDLGGRPSFREVVRRAKTTALDAYAHQNLPFATLVQNLHPDRDPSRNPLFQVLFQMINVPTLEQLTNQQRDAAMPTGRTGSAFDLSFALQPDGRGGLDLEIEYATDLFDETTVARLADHLLRLLDAALREPDRAIAELDLISADERAWLLDAGRGEVVPEPGEPDLNKLFADRVAADPQAPALITPERTVSYRELDQDVGALAAQLHRAGVRRQQPVLVWLPRRGTHVAALLGTLRLGAIYVPVAADTPPVRVARILGSVGAAALVTTAELGEGVDPGRVPIVVVSGSVGDDSGGRRRRPSGPQPVIARPDDIAYVIHTSGSTGLPKGVQVPHRQLLNRLHWMWRCYPFEDGEMGCHKTSISFVDSLWEMLGPLLAGVPAVVLPEETVRDPAALVTALAESSVTRIWLVPALLAALLDSVPDLGDRLPQLRFWVSSGEPLSVTLFDRFGGAHPSATLFNLYGTSEVWDATWWVPPTDPRQRPRWRIPLGRPIDNVVVRVLDGDGALVPIGVPGELYVGGAGLASGYLGAPGRDERFVPDPLEPGQLLYRTFDLVRWLPTGDLEFVSRRDGVVKINGYRVHPGEVEEALTTLPGIRTAAVIPVDSPDGTRLAAYLVPEHGVTPDPVELRQQLAGGLPRYMLPAEIVVVTDLPHTSSGKIDRRSLRTARLATDSGSPRRLGAPVNEIERTIAEVWHSLLDADVGREDNFFDLGGHSLLLVRVRERLLPLFGGELSITDMFRYPTVAGLARHLIERDETVEVAK